MWSEPYCRYLCVLVALLGPLAAFSWPQDDCVWATSIESGEGATLVNNAWEQRDEVRSKPDCSHLVHADFTSYRVFPYPLRKFL